jgi:hypothetical protein
MQLSDAPESRRRTGATHTFTIGVVESLQLYDVGMSDNAHDLELAVLAG